MVKDMKVFKGRKRKKNNKFIIAMIILLTFVYGLFLFSSLFQNPKFIEVLLDSSVRNSKSKSIGPIYDYLLDYSIGRMPVSDEEYIGSLSSMEYVEDPEARANEIKAGMENLVHLYDNFREACDKFNDLLPSGIENASAYNFKPYISYQ